MSLRTIGQFVLCVAFCLFGVTATYARGGGKATVYAFGYATCLGDTVAYISEIQQLDSAKINAKTKTLEEISTYAHQLEQTLRARDGKHYTAAVFFATDRKKIEKQFLRVKKTTQHKKTATASTKIETLTAQDFTFKAVAPTTE